MDGQQNTMKYLINRIAIIKIRKCTVLTYFIYPVSVRPRYIGSLYSASMSTTLSGCDFRHGKIMSGGNNSPAAFAVIWPVTSCLPSEATSCKSKK